jgi:GTP-binding protein HflX
VDATTRLIRLSSRRRALVVDTVGFINNLPAAVVQGFRSTIEEIQLAALVLHVSDVSNPGWRQQDGHINDILREIGALDAPRLHVFNKIDLLSARELDRLIDEHSQDPASNVFVSAAEKRGLNDLLERIDIKLQQDPLVRMRIKIPYAEAKTIADITAQARIFSNEYGDEFAIFDLHVPASLAIRLRTYVIESDAD